MLESSVAPGANCEISPEAVASPPTEPICTSRLCAPADELVLVMLSGVDAPVEPVRASGTAIVPFADAIDGVASVPEGDRIEPVTVMYCGMRSDVPPGLTLVASIVTICEKLPVLAVESAIVNGVVVPPAEICEPSNPERLSVKSVLSLAPRVARPPS